MSAKPKVLVTNCLPKEGMRMLEGYCEVKVFDYEGALPRKVLLKVVVV